MPYKYNPIEGQFDLVNAAATPAVGSIVAGNKINTTTAGTAVTINADTDLVASVATDSGTATPVANSMSIVGGGGVVVSAIGSVVTVTGGGSIPPKEFSFNAEGLVAIETNFGALTQLTGTNVKILVRAFDATTEEYANGKFFVPSNFNTSGTITFRAYVSAATAAASKNIGLTFGHRAVTDNESWDQTYTDVDSGAISIAATQDRLTLVTWTVANSTAGWAANDMIEFRISRDTSVANNLVGDMYLFNFEVSVPRT